MINNKKVSLLTLLNIIMQPLSVFLNLAHIQFLLAFEHDKLDMSNKLVRDPRAIPVLEESYQL